MQAVQAAALEAQKRAERFRLMQKLVRRANNQVLVKRNGVAAAVGGAWAARQYVHEPPKLVEEAWDRVRGGKDQEHGRESAAAQPRTAAQLLAPARPHPGGAQAHLQIMTMVSHAGGRR